MTRPSSPATKSYAGFMLSIRSSTSVRSRNMRHTSRLWDPNPMLSTRPSSFHEIIMSYSPPPMIRSASEGSSTQWNRSRSAWSSPYFLSSVSNASRHSPGSRVAAYSPAG